MPNTRHTFFHTELTALCAAVSDKAANVHTEKETFITIYIITNSEYLSSNLSVGLKREIFSQNEIKIC